MLTCVRKLTFESGHRVFGHEGKCKHAHGHSYKAFFYAQGDLDSLGRVIDFSVLKEKIGGWIDLNLDHAFLVFIEDQEMIRFLSQTGQKYFAMENPTAENIAKFLLAQSIWLLDGTGVKVVRVDVHETENCYAIAQR